MATISLDQAREKVWSRRFASKCVKLTQEQWDMIIELQNKDRVPRKLVPKLERALWLRELLDNQLAEAAKWLIKHGLHEAEINSEVLEHALREEFCENPPSSVLPEPEIERLLKEYLQSEPSPTQKNGLKFLNAKAKGRHVSRKWARDTYNRLSPTPVTRGRPRLK
jgi:hypothetical protein